MGLRAWGRKVRRRKGGVYLVRTRKHNNPMRRETGYVGESVSFRAREADHRGAGRYGNKAKDWTDLDPKWHRVIPLPWWLCWKPVLRSLETLVILLTWPRYNVAKNKWNPRRIPPYLAQHQRAVRDAGGSAYRAQVATARAVRALLMFAGVVLILGGIYGTVVSQ